MSKAQQLIALVESTKADDVAELLAKNLIKVIYKILDEKGIGSAYIDPYDLADDLASRIDKYDDSTASSNDLDKELWQAIILPSLKPFFAKNKYKGFGPRSVQMRMKKLLDKTDDNWSKVSKAIRAFYKSKGI
jgi:hypothetical protein